MALSVERIESLIEDDPNVESALRVVIESTDGGAREVEWGDVREDLSSGQWGRLIETGVLESGEEGFVLADPQSAMEAVDGVDPADYEPDEPTGSDAETGAETGGSGSSSSSSDDEGWSNLDKAAAVGSVGLFAGYSIKTVRGLIGGTLDIVLGPLDQLLPFYLVIMCMAVLTGMYSTLLQANLMNMDKLAEYQEQMKAIQEKQKRAKERDDQEALDEIREEQMDAMGDQLGMFKVQFKPMVWIMLLTIPVFLWMYWKILPQGGGQIVGAEGTLVMPLIGEVTQWTQGVIGPVQAWIVWYFLCSMAFTQIIRKALNIQTSPTT